MPKKLHSDADPLNELNEKLKSSDPEIQRYVLALRKENRSLEDKIAKLQAAITSRDNVNAGEFDREISEISDDERAGNIAQLMTKPFAILWGAAQALVDRIDAIDEPTRTSLDPELKQLRDLLSKSS